MTSPACGANTGRPPQALFFDTDVSANRNRKLSESEKHIAYFFLFFPGYLLLFFLYIFHRRYRRKTYLTKDPMMNSANDTKITNPYEIYRFLPQTNCGECSLPNCLAFSAAVIKGSKQVSDCPYIKNAEKEILAGRINIREDFTRVRGEDLETLKAKIGDIDFSAKAEALGARVVSGRLAVKSLGKDFFIDARGNVTSECHTHAWMTVPLLSYIVQSKGGNITGRWVPFRELRDGSAMNPLFVQRGEKPLKKLLDSHSELLGELLSMFSGERADNNLFSSDIALSLYPLPKVPILICYWKPEGGMGSDLNIFFDASAENHLKIEGLFSLGVGLVMMFEKIARKHS